MCIKETHTYACHCSKNRLVTSFYRVYYSVVITSIYNQVKFLHTQLYYLMVKWQ